MPSATPTSLARAETGSKFKFCHGDKAPAKACLSVGSIAGSYGRSLAGLVVYDVGAARPRSFRPQAARFQDIALKEIVEERSDDRDGGQRPMSSQLGALAVSMMSAASWNVRPSDQPARVAQVPIA